MMPKLKINSEHVCDAAMTWNEIGAALGISGKGAFMIYKNALKKLRARPARLRRLRELARSKQAASL
jgi:DNA-directed RNA polymerase sigma subunit (sigma70/sigma32)